MRDCLRDIFPAADPSDVQFAYLLGAIDAATEITAKLEVDDDFAR
ncbi:hypothetical protein [Sphingomonas sp. Leaf257]|nr:hypothetical protein [Sphingomonas sp. Leaf257]